MIEMDYVYIGAGLPDSTTEGRLKKAFSQFGEVVQGEFLCSASNVKI